MQETRQETKTAEREVDKRVGATESFLDPDAYRWELVNVSVLGAVEPWVADKQLVPATAVGASTY